MKCFPQINARRISRRCGTFAPRKTTANDETETQFGTIPAALPGHTERFRAFRHGHVPAGVSRAHGVFRSLLVDGATEPDREHDRSGRGTTVLRHGQRQIRPAAGAADGARAVHAGHGGLSAGRNHPRLHRKDAGNIDARNEYSLPTGKSSIYA